MAWLRYISITLTLGRPPVRRVVKVAWQAFFNESFRSEELFQRLHVQWASFLHSARKVRNANTGALDIDKV
ncbi:hypothetical protein AK812_SmicGene23136 [Symbiodinium microadriaticum]|uniref:Uncharacterized protein n=1 Tax=Symbiodinium microadriaticum TaxID=2951 RepID=A0A1Q9DI05_SYMMI|nr:hypothetical protein AK812_SmicGene23136 [Symbiodinium microadriaticum]